MKKVLIKNSVQCLECGVVLTSKRRHDWVCCDCENHAFTDGGLAYQRVGAKDLNKVKDLSVWREKSQAEIEEEQKLNEEIRKLHQTQLMDYLFKELNR